MSRNKVNQDGSLSMIAGRGKAEYGASTVRTGTITFTPPEPQNNTQVVITFSEPMPDNDYIVSFDLDSGCMGFIGLYTAKTVNGFTANIRNVSDISAASIGTCHLIYHAFKLYTDTEYNNIIDAVPSGASSSNQLVTENEVNANKSFGTPVDIKGYNIANNMYTAPSDGLFMIRNQGSESGYFYINTVIGGSNVTLIAENGGYKGQSVFAKKGTSVYCTFDTTITASNMKVLFIPFV